MLNVPMMLRELQWQKRMVVRGVFVVTCLTPVFGAARSTAGVRMAFWRCGKHVANAWRCCDTIAELHRYYLIYTVLDRSSSSDHAAFATAAGRGHGAVVTHCPATLQLTISSGNSPLDYISGAGTHATATPRQTTM